MPETFQLFRALLPAPSGVTEEHALVADVIKEWNVQHSDSAAARVELLNWRTHAHPETGRRRAPFCHTRLPIAELIS
jgi:hypothetical protein